MNTVLAIWSGGMIVSVTGYLAALSAGGKTAPVLILVLATLGWPLTAGATLLGMLVQAFSHKP